MIGKSTKMYVYEEMNCCFKSQKKKFYSKKKGIGIILGPFEAYMQNISFVSHVNPNVNKAYLLSSVE